MIWRLALTVILLSFIPTAAICIYMLRKYRAEVLSRKLFIRLMILGALAVIPGIILVSLVSGFFSVDKLSTYLIKPFIAVALIEEMIKLLILSLVLYRNTHFRTIKNGIQYSIAIAVGFAFAENIIYMTGSQSSFPLLLLRSLTALPLHVICGAYTGYFAGRGKTMEKRFFGKALLTAVTIHGLYNLLVNLYFPYYLLSVILLIISVFILKHQYSKKDSIGSFKDT